MIELSLTWLQRWLVTVYIYASERLFPRACERLNSISTKNDINIEALDYEFT